MLAKAGKIILRVVPEMIESLVLSHNELWYRIKRS